MSKILETFGVEVQEAEESWVWAEVRNASISPGGVGCGRSCKRESRVRTEPGSLRV